MGLTEILGPDLTDSLMSYLPTTPATELATKADIDGLSDRVDRLSGRIDRLQTTLLGGFAAMIAALLAAGFLG
jgi:ubiquinone biosynthesis protein UbiJ